jgi:N-acetylglucosaminyldiphosphoundecaprenol N-acetyl-beta-D-mannosaminyltransferase
MTADASREVRNRIATFSVYIDAINWDGAVLRVVNWAKKRESRYVCLCNVHSVVTARSNTVHKKAIRDADLAIPDGMPIAWILRRLGSPNQERLSGPDLMWKLCSVAEVEGQGIFLLGSTTETLELLVMRLKAAFPRLNIVGAYSPPFRRIFSEDDREIVRMVNEVRANIVFVGLGCPKQEHWMMVHRGRICGVMLGVGAAFDYHAGTLRRAPMWMQNAGLEWFHRLCMEPRRMWRRYLRTNIRFLFMVIQQLVFRRSSE